MTDEQLAAEQPQAAAPGSEQTTASEPGQGAGPPPPNWEDQLRRALADLDNLRKRQERELGRVAATERMRVAAEWLPVLDNLERALAPTDGGDDSPIARGVRAVYEQALDVIQRLGFPRFTDVGEAFDPQRHEAVSAVATDAPAGTIVGAIRAGYGTPPALLRPAGVVVSTGQD